MALHAYEARAVQEAIESGMARSELTAILDGLRVTEVVPPCEDEPPEDYAARATAELMVRYLAQDGLRPV
ncbi:hypothetical protein MKK58_05820 [Methylobacterium sp. J-078]|uniref:hypothetical protein n=1 Tax=Methylobacterium sp. J-078 TaxID=2836657 RepID=UPI001FBAFE73|nr:hypothetical protein [Methylobacterium sp. J-078]MCJ2044051.1 hypothetical protein [Methylobacterium sp. J-078]